MIAFYWSLIILYNFQVNHVVEKPVAVPYVQYVDRPIHIPYILPVEVPVAYHVPYLGSYLDRFSYVPKIMKIYWNVTLILIFDKQQWNHRLRRRQSTILSSKQQNTLNMACLIGNTITTTSTLSTLSSRSQVTFWLKIL